MMVRNFESFSVSDRCCSLTLSFEKQLVAAYGLGSTNLGLGLTNSYQCRTVVGYSVLT